VSRKSSAPKSSRRREPAGARPRSRKVLVSVIAAALVVLAAGVAAFVALPRVKKWGIGRAVDVEIPVGASDDEVVARLEAAGVIGDRRLFMLYLRTIGGAQAKPGRHLLSDDLSAAEVVRRLRRTGDAMRVKVTFPEGWNRFDMARRLHDKRVCDGDAFLAATTDRALLDEVGVTGASAEGFLFPATYSFSADGEARDVARELMKQGKSRLDKLMRDNAAGVDDLRTTLHFGPVEIVTLASIVEKEAVADEERPVIASVFLNRLRDPGFTPRLLQADPTAAYGCLAGAPTPACATWLATGSTKPNAEIEHDASNAWSTYTHEGLPPSPIANPGEKSLLAVLSPARTRYLYFVARGGGRHTFSETLEDHNQAVKPK
jgi:UPF0755 protein